MDSVIQLMNAVLFGTDADRTSATQQLQSLFEAPGFIQLLAQLLLNPSVPTHFRQLAGTLLRDACRSHWNVVAPGDQAELRKLIIPCIADSNSRLRTAAGAVVAAIAKHDFPERWPELLPQIHDYLVSSNEQVVSGALRCFQMIAEQLSDKELMPVLQTISPVLLGLFSAPTASKRIRARCTIIFHKLLDLLGMVKSQFPKEANAVLKQILPGWLPHLATTLTSPVGDDQDYSVHLGALRVLNVVVQHFSNAVVKPIKAILPAVWGLLVSGATQYDCFANAV